MDGQQVAGSPFPVSVSKPPTQLGKPVKVLYGIHHAGGITINIAGDILMMEILSSSTQRRRSLYLLHILKVR